MDSENKLNYVSNLDVSIPISIYVRIEIKKLLITKYKMLNHDITFVHYT